MLRITYTYLIIIFISATVIGQDFFNDQLNYSIPNDASEHYDWVTNFNDQNLYSDKFYKTEKTHQLDSIFDIILNNPGVNRYKSLYFYDDNYEVIVSYSLIGTGSYQPRSIIIHYYNNDNLLINQTFGSWDGDLNNLNDNNPLVLRSYYYNNDSQLVEIHIQEEYAIINKIPQQVIYYEYNDDDQVTDIITTVWSVQLDSLIERNGFHYDYDDNKLLKNWVTYKIDEDAGYYATDSIVYRHNSDGLVDQEISHMTSNPDMEIKVSKEIDTQYDEDNKITRQERRTRYRYGIARDTDTLFYRYYPSGSIRDIDYIRRDSSLLAGTGFLFDKVIKRFTYEYNHDITFDKILKPRHHMLKYEDNHMLLEAQEYSDLYGFDATESNLGETRNTRYFYSEIIRTPTEDIKESNTYFSIYPNPVQDVIEVISSDEYTGEFTVLLSDINGRRIMEQVTYLNNTIDISHLLPGVYIYSITSDVKRSTGKLVVQ